MASTPWSPAASPMISRSSAVSSPASSLNPDWWAPAPDLRRLRTSGPSPGVGRRQFHQCDKAPFECPAPRFRMLKAMPKLLVTRLDAELVEAVDGLVRDGIVANRSEAVRIGLEQLVDRSRRSEIGAAIVEGYRRVPQTDQGLGRADNGLRA